jgi:hypothetical protein
MSFGTLLSPKRRSDRRTIALHWVDYQQQSITAVLTLPPSFSGNTHLHASDISYDIKIGRDVFKNQKIIVRLSYKDRLKGDPDSRGNWICPPHTCPPYGLVVPNRAFACLNYRTK